MQTQQMNELTRLNDQLQCKYDLAAKELALQQELSHNLTQQLESAEAHLQQAQDTQQSLLLDLRQHQQLQLEMQLKQPATEAEHSKQLKGLRQQLAVAQSLVADKDRALQDLTVKWNGAVTQVEELQLQLQQESNNHQQLLR